MFIDERASSFRQTVQLGIWSGKEHIEWKNFAIELSQGILAIEHVSFAAIARSETSVCI
jgi:hypothetical protein